MAAAADVVGMEDVKAGHGIAVKGHTGEGLPGKECAGGVRVEDIGLGKGHAVFDNAVPDGSGGCEGGFRERLNLHKGLL